LIIIVQLQINIDEYSSEKVHKKQSTMRTTDAQLKPPAKPARAMSL